MRDLAEDPRPPPTEREELTGLLDYHRTETAVHDYFEAAEGHVKAWGPSGAKPKTGAYTLRTSPVGRIGTGKRGDLKGAGRAILADEDTYGAYLDAVAAGKPRVRLTVDQLRNRIKDGRARQPSRRDRSPAAIRSPRSRKASRMSLKTPRSSRSSESSSKSGSANSAGDTREAEASAFKCRSRTDSDK